MKQIFYILIIAIPTLFYGQGISVDIDTLDISNNGLLSEVAFYKGHFHFLFQTGRRYTDETFKSMKIYDTKGDFVENVFLPKEAINMVYSDLRVNKQHLYLIEENSSSKETFLLEKYMANFNQIQDTIISIYEDSDFIIYPNCQGEWGASTYFKHKKDNKVYEFSSTCNFNFEKTKNGYLLTNGNEILIIKNPTELYESKLTFDRSYLKKRNQGVDTFFKSKYDLYTTFQIDDKLMVIYGDSTGTHIGELKNSELKSVYDFKKPYRFSYWFKNNNTNSQILEMYTYKSIGDFGILEGYKMKGLLFINNGKIKMYFIK